MAVRIRLARAGSKKRPFYRIVAADQRAPRDGRYIEKLGTYNPMLPKDHAERVVINSDRVNHWVSVGGQMTDRVARLLSVQQLCATPAIPSQTKQSKPKAKALERIREKEEAAKAAAEAAAQAAEEAKAAAEAPAEEASEG